MSLLPLDPFPVYWCPARILRVSYPHFSAAPWLLPSLIPRDPFWLHTLSSCCELHFHFDLSSLKSHRSFLKCKLQQALWHRASSILCFCEWNYLFPLRVALRSYRIPSTPEPWPYLEIRGVADVNSSKMRSYWSRLTSLTTSGVIRRKRACEHMHTGRTQCDSTHRVAMQSQSKEHQRLLANHKRPRKGREELSYRLQR